MKRFITTINIDLLQQSNIDGKYNMRICTIKRNDPLLRIVIRLQ